MGRIRSRVALHLSLLIAVVTFCFLARGVVRGSFHVLANTAARNSAARPDAGTQFAKSSVHLPLSFEENRGQFERQTRFVARGQNYRAAFSANGIALQGLRSDSLKQTTRVQNGPAKSRSELVNLRFQGTDPKASMEGAGELPGTMNYFLGSRKQWHTGIPLYREVKYANLYPGVDLIYYGNSGQLENDFVIAPGAAPDRISFVVSTNAAPQVSAAGDLVLHSSSGSFILRKPNAYQLVDGQKRTVEVSYALDRDRVRFRTGAYDTSRGLIIDPVIIYSTYLGGDAGGDQGAEVLASAVDASGNIYIAGLNQDLDFPNPPPAFSQSHGGFISKIDPTGTTLTYSAVFPSAINGIAIDSTGDVYAVTNASTNFPIVGSVFQTAAKATNGDPVVFELNPGGTGFVYATYLGGNGGGDSANAIALDSAGNAYVAGQTNSPDFPVASPLQPALDGTTDGFISKISAGGTTLIYSTYLGGSGTDFFTSIAVDASDNMYVTGNTTSSAFPMVNPVPTTPGAIVAELNASGSALTYATSLTGASTDQGNAIVVDSSSPANAYVAGQTSSCSFQLQQPLSSQFPCATIPDAFLAKIGPTGSLLFSSFLGGNGGATSVALDGSGDAYVASVSGATNLPAVNAVQPAGPGAFVAEISGLGSTISPALAFSTYLGSATYVAPGTGITAQVPALVGLDGSGNIYVAGTTQTGFPIVNPGVVQPVFAGGQRNNQQDPVLAAFVTKISPSAGAAAGFTPAAVSFQSTLQGSTSSPQTVTVTNLGTSTLAISSIAATGDFKETDTCTAAGNLAAGATCTISVTFTPTASGARTGTLTVTDNAAGSPQTLQLSGNGVTAIASFSTSSVTFSSQPVGTPSNPQTVTLTNTGTAALTVTSVTASNGFTQSNNCSTLGLPGSGTNNCTVNVVFDPPASGAITGTLSVADNATGSPQTVSLSGTGTSSAAIVLSPASLSFGAQSTGTAGSKNISLKNAGDLPLSITSITTTGSFAQTNSCGSIVAPGAICTITVTFTPAVTGTQTGALTITDNAPASPQSVALSGTGVQAGSDFNFTATDSSPAVSSTVVPTTTVVTNNQPTATILTPGGSASYNLNVIGVNGFGGTVQFECSGIPTLSTCNVSPNPTTISSSFPIPVTMTVSTQAGTVTNQTCTTSDAPPFSPLPPWSGPGGMLGAIALAGLAFLALFTTRAAGGRKGALASMGAVAFLLIVCGSCGGGTTTTCTPTNATPVGDYTLTVTGTSGTATSNVSLSMTICTKTQSSTSNNTTTVICAPVTSSSLRQRAAMQTQPAPKIETEPKAIRFEPRAIPLSTDVR